MHVSVSKYFNALERESRFFLELNAAENTDYIEKSFKQKFCRIKSNTKNSLDAHLCLLWGWS